MSRMRSEIPSWNYARHIFLKHDLLVLVITVADNFSSPNKQRCQVLMFSDVRMGTLDERHRARIERMMVEEEEEVKQLEVSSTIYDDDSDSDDDSWLL